jgi:hypothetical protein
MRTNSVNFLGRYVCLTVVLFFDLLMCLSFIFIFIRLSVGACCLHYGKSIDVSSPFCVLI